eukprot:3373407-Pyramimonas_sp.AAC.1
MEAEVVPDGNLPTQEGYTYRSCLLWCWARWVRSVVADPFGTATSSLFENLGVRGVSGRHELEKITYLSHRNNSNPAHPVQPGPTRCLWLPAPYIHADVGAACQAMLGAGISAADVY